MLLKMMMKADEAFTTMRKAINEVDEDMQAPLMALFLDYWTAKRGTTMKEFFEMALDANKYVEAQEGKIDVEAFEQESEVQG